QKRERIGHHWRDRGCFDALITTAQEVSKGLYSFHDVGDAGRIVECSDPKAAETDFSVIAKYRKIVLPVKVCINIMTVIHEGEGITPPLKVNDADHCGQHTHYASGGVPAPRFPTDEQHSAQI